MEPDIDGLSDHVECQCLPNLMQFLSLVHMESHSWFSVSNNHIKSVILLGSLTYNEHVLKLCYSIWEPCVACEPLKSD